METPELQLNKANASDTEVPFLDLHLRISTDLLQPKVMISAMFLILTSFIFHILDGDVPRSTSYGIYISQLIRSAGVSSHVTDFNASKKILTAELL